MLSIVIGLFGMIGAVARYYLSAIPLWDDSIFPIGTLCCNLFGCFLLGWFNQVIKASKNVHPYIKTGIETGMIGSFTTFSTFSIESVQLFMSHKIALGILYILTSFVGGWFLVWVGDRTGRTMRKIERGEV